MKFDKRLLKKALAIITTLMFIVSLYQIHSTYSLLQSEVIGNVEHKIAKWNIELNNTDITNGTSQEIIIRDFTFVVDSNVKEGKIAPGVYGMIDLTIDPKDTDVSVRYDITLGDIQDLPISINDIEIVDGNGTLIKTDKDTYTGIMKLDKIKNNTAKVTVRITVAWENREENNEKDTEIGTQSGYTLDIPINVKAVQYLGEQITEYE